MEVMPTGLSRAEMGLEEEEIDGATPQNKPSVEDPQTSEQLNLDSGDSSGDAGSESSGDSGGANSGPPTQMTYGQKGGASHSGPSRSGGSGGGGEGIGSAAVKVGKEIGELVDPFK